MPEKCQNVVLDDDGEELTPHGSVENLYIPTGKNIQSLPINGSTISPPYSMEGKVGPSNDNGTGNGVPNQSSSSQAENLIHTHLRRSTSMSCPSQGGSLSGTKTVTFTLPITEVYYVILILLLHLIFIVI